MALTYENLCDSIIDKLKIDNVTLGVALTSIVDGGKEATLPSINVFVSPESDEDSESGEAHLLSTTIEIVCRVKGYETDGKARRNAVALAGLVIDSLSKVLETATFKGWQFAETNADSTFVVIKYKTNIVAL